MLRIGVDIGGTFTDFVLLDPATGTADTQKLLTTPRDPSVAMLAGIRQLLATTGTDIRSIGEIVHGTTLITNSVIERRGPPTGMLVTTGFRDVLDIGKEQRYDIYDLRLGFPAPLVPPMLRAEIEERTTFWGKVETPIDAEAVASVVAALADKGISSLAICFLHSYANRSNERAAAQVVAERFPSLYVTQSSDVAPFIREFDRWTTATVNAYAQSLADGYLRGLERGLEQMGFTGRLYIMTSSGGTITPATARRYPVRLIESGPAAGALMSAVHSAHLKMPNALAFDMGGTTAKGTLIEKSELARRDNIEVAHAHGFKKGSGLPLKIPAIDLIEIGAGGGSIAAPDRRGVIAVGPLSAGAEPGPACYGLGGDEPTLTDANLMLGYLNAGFFVGGAMQLSPHQSRSVIDAKVAGPLQLDVLRAAWGIHETVNEDVARAFRVHAAARGFDYRNAAMIAFGGSGPVHAVRIARKLRIPRAVFPAGAGVMSAFGLLASPTNFEVIQTGRVLASELSAVEFVRRFQEVSDEATSFLIAAGIGKESIATLQRLDMRYQGQGHEIEVAIPPRHDLECAFAKLPQWFAEQYARVYAMSFLEQPLEIVNWKVEARGPAPSIGPTGMKLRDFSAGRKRAAIKGRRKAYFPEGDGYVECSVYDRYALKTGACISGPALIEERESTSVIGFGDVVTVDGAHNLVVDVTRPAKGSRSA